MGCVMVEVVVDVGESRRQDGGGLQVIALSGLQVVGVVSGIDEGQVGAAALVAAGVAVLLRGRTTAAWPVASRGARAVSPGVVPEK